MQHFTWLYVGVIAVDDDYGRPASAQFVEEVEQNGVCIAFREVLPQIKDPEAIFLLGKMFLYNNSTTNIKLVICNFVNIRVCCVFMTNAEHQIIH